MCKNFKHPQIASAKKNNKIMEPAVPTNARVSI